MAKSEKVKLTCEEGQLLLQLSGSFDLPEKKGDSDIGYDNIQRAIAREEVRMLFRELKGHSPYVQKRGKDFLNIFGPADNIEDSTMNGKQGKAHVKPEHEVELRLSEDALSGAVWCLIGCLHPGIGMIPVSVADSLAWPIAQKIKRVHAVREAIGINTPSPKTWKPDPDTNGENAPEATA